MRRAFATLTWLGGLLALGTALHAQAPSDVLSGLEDGVARLEEEVEALEPGDPSTVRFRERAVELREELIYLKVKARHHREAGGVGSGLDESELKGAQRRLDDLRADLDHAFGRRAELALPAGTAIQVSLDDPVSSRTARIEDRVSTRVVEDVRVDGRVAIPAGTRVRGIVRDVEAAKRPSKSGRLELAFDALYLEAERYDLAARVSEIQQGSGTAKKAGIGAAVGAVIGGLLGGKDGAIAGVLIGGGGAVAGTRGEDVELPAGSVVTVRLERALRLPAR